VILIPAPQNNTHKDLKIFDLDIPSNIYPAIKTKKWNQVFRVSAVLKQDVQPQVLARAVSDLKERFPTFYVQLKVGFFRYSLVEVFDTDVVIPENDYPCLPVVVGSGQKPMFRVLYIKNRVSLEVFHVLTDGGGALCFLKNIVARYLELLGCRFDKTDGVVDYTEEPKDYETEDAFKSLYQKELKREARKEPAAYRYRPAYKENYLNVIHGLLRVDELKQLTKAKGVTITEYLTAAYIYAFYLDMLPRISKKEIRISVPCELRRLFDFKTVRNCSLYTNIGVHADRPDYTFDEILAETVAKLKEGLNKETLRRIASMNTKDTNLLAFRLSPVFMKNFYLKVGFALFGPRIMTTNFSNFGIVTVPKGMEEHIDHFEFMLGSTPNSMLNCGTVTFGNIINVTFACVSEAVNVQRHFFKFLSEQGIHIRIQSNIQTETFMEAL